MLPKHLQRCTPGLPSNNGFSLIELLLVITLIGLISSLLGPALLRAKQRAQQLECLTRQREWARAFKMYADENNDWLPREGYHTNGEVLWNNWRQISAPESADAWFNGLATILRITPAAGYSSPETRLSFYQRASGFHCPAARLPPATKSVGFQIALFSLAMNSQLVDPPNVPYVRLSRVQDVTRTVLMLDNLLEKEPPVVDAQARDNLGQPAAFANRFAGRRHGSGGNLAFVDGHAEFYRGEEVVETKGITAGWPILPPVNIVWDTP